MDENQVIEVNMNLRGFLGELTAWFAKSTPWRSKLVFSNDMKEKAIATKGRPTVTVMQKKTPKLDSYPLKYRDKNVKNEERGKD